jgi:hypothetical protein
MPIRIIDKARDREEASVKDKKKKSKLKELEGDVESSTAAYKMLVGGQAKLDKNKNNKIDAQDFKILKAEKAKGRGQGLQDEKMKPGKPMKAALGAIALGLGAKKMMDKKGSKMPMGMGAAAFLAKKKKEMLGKKMGGVMKAKRGKLVPLKKDPTKAISSVKPSAGGKGSGTTNLGNPRKSGENFMERRLKLKGLGKAGRIGAAITALGIAGAGAAKVGQTIGRKMSEKKNKKMGGGMMKRPMGYKKGSKKEIEIKKFFKKYGTFPYVKPKKKMGGGMMQRPGYNVGGSVTVKTKLGRNKPTKMY